MLIFSFYPFFVLFCVVFLMELQIMALRELYNHDTIFRLK